MDTQESNFFKYTFLCKLHGFNTPSQSLTGSGAASLLLCQKFFRTMVSLLFCEHLGSTVLRFFKSFSIPLFSLCLHIHWLRVQGSLSFTQMCVWFLFYLLIKGDTIILKFKQKYKYLRGIKKTNKQTNKKTDLRTHPTSTVIRSM